jgi:L-cysteate sulfo-lyase
MLPSTLLKERLRVSLGTWPTPLEPMNNLRKALGGSRKCPQLWAKREDLVGLAGGGNKVRKLECIMAHAQSLGADTIINTGGVQSNQIRQTAGAAARLGMECHLLLARQPTLITPNYEHTGNILVCRMLGAHIHFVEHDCDREAAMQALASQLRDQRKKPYVIPVGASSPEGILGSAMCGEEIFVQAQSAGFQINGLAVTVGSAGTCAGIFAGIHATLSLQNTPNHTNMRLLGVDVLGQAHAESPEKRIYKHLCEACEALSIKIPQEALRRNDSLENLPPVGGWDGPVLEITGSYAGPGYARPYPEMVEAIELTGRTEGILLDPIYTGKTMAAMVAAIRKGYFAPHENVIFLHSGGQFSIFAYADLFDKDLTNEQSHQG